MPNKYNKPGLRSTEDQNGGHGVILCDVGPEDQGLPGRVRLKFDFFLGLHGGFQLLDLILRELKSHMICYNSMPLIG